MHSTERNQPYERNLLSAQQILNQFGYSKIAKSELVKELSKYLGKDRNTILLITRRLLKFGVDKNISCEKTTYTRATQKATFSCAIHGDFEQTPLNRIFLFPDYN